MEQADNARKAAADEARFAAMKEQVDAQAKVLESSSVERQTAVDKALQAQAAENERVEKQKQDMQTAVAAAQAAAQLKLDAAILLATEKADAANVKAAEEVRAAQARAEAAERDIARFRTELAETEKKRIVDEAERQTRQVEAEAARLLAQARADATREREARDAERAALLAESNRALAKAEADAKRQHDAHAVALQALQVTAAAAQAASDARELRSTEHAAALLKERQAAFDKERMDQDAASAKWKKEASDAIEREILRRKEDLERSDRDRALYRAETLTSSQQTLSVVTSITQQHIQQLAASQGASRPAWPGQLSFPGVLPSPAHIPPMLAAAPGDDTPEGGRVRCRGGTRRL
jgi:hypothetical protein